MPKALFLLQVILIYLMKATASFCYRSEPDFFYQQCKWTRSTYKVEMALLYHQITVQKCNLGI